MLFIENFRGTAGIKHSWYEWYDPVKTEMVYLTGLSKAPRDACDSQTNPFCVEECKRMYGPNGESGIGDDGTCFMMVACVGELNNYDIHEFGLCAQLVAYNPVIICEIPCK